MLAGGRADLKSSSSALADKLELIAEYLGEDDFVSAVKGYKPDMTKQGLQEWIMLFRAAVREKRGLY
jgi:hypothetical protein